MREQDYPQKKRETIPDPTKILQKMERVGNMKKIDGLGKLTSLYQEKMEREVTVLSL